MSKGNTVIFRVLHVIAWLFFIGLSIEAGGLIVNFIFSVFKPEMVGRLYQKLDLSEMYRQSKMAYFGIYSFLLTIAILKAWLFYVVIDLMHKMDLDKPFSAFVSQQITRISYYTISIGLFSHVGRQIAKSLQRHFTVDQLQGFWEDSQAFILMGAVTYVIATIFRQGIQLQEENDLTV